MHFYSRKFFNQTVFSKEINLKMSKKKLSFFAAFAEHKSGQSKKKEFQNFSSLQRLGKRQRTQKLEKRRNPRVLCNLRIIQNLLKPRKPKIP